MHMKKFWLITLFLSYALFSEAATLGSDWNTLFGTSYSGTFSVKANELSLSGTDGGVTITVKNGSSTNGYIKTGDFRAYNGYTVTISSSSAITQIVAQAGGKAIANVTADVGTLSISGKSMTWTGSSNTIVFSFSGTCGFESMEVTTGGVATTYTLSYNANGGTGSMSDVEQTSSTFTAANCTFTAPENKMFKEWNTKSDGSGTSVAPSDSYKISSGTTATLYAIWKAAGCDEIDFEDALSTYTDWTFNNIAQTNATITAHGGSYYGKTNAKSTAYIQTNSKIAAPGTLTCYLSKTTNNTTSSTWKIQVSSNGSSWTDAGSHSATSMTAGNWVEFSADLSAYTNVYVRIYYSGSTAVRAIDDISLCASGPSLKLDKQTLTATRPNEGSGTLTVTPAMFTPTGYTWTSSDASVATVAGSGANATVTYHGSGTATITCSATDGTVTKEATCSVTVPTTYTVTLYDDGQSRTGASGLVSGEKYTLPAGGHSSCTEYTFLGWTKTAYTDGTSTKPDILSGEQTITEDITYYAVYSYEDEAATKKYRVTDNLSDFTNGTHVAIRCANSSTKKGLKNDGSEVNYTDNLSAGKENIGTITTSTQAWTIVYDDSYGDGYNWAFYNGEKYLGMSSSSSGATVDLQDEPDRWMISVASNGQCELLYDASLYLEYYGSSWQLYNRSVDGTKMWLLVEYTPASYTTTPECGPRITIAGTPYVTSTKSVTVQAPDLSVVGTRLTGSALTVTSNNAHFVPTLTSTTITAGEATTTLLVDYTPAVFATDETAIITVTDNVGSTSATIEVHGRSLPEHFVIASKVNDAWYALPGNMCGAGTYEGLPISVDNDANPTRATYAAPQAKYLLAGVGSRYATVPKKVRFYSRDGGADGGKMLWMPSSGNTGIKNYLAIDKPATEATDYEWLLTTDDNITYHIFGEKCARYLRSSFSGAKNWGTYNSGINDLRLLPVDNECTYFIVPMSLSVSSKTSSEVVCSCRPVPGATNYQWRIGTSGDWTDASFTTFGSGTTARVSITIDGLSSATTYSTLYIRGTDGTDTGLCAANNGGLVPTFTTDNCDDAPLILGVGTSTSSATITWTCQAATADIVLYTDDTYASVSRTITGVTSPYTVDGLVLGETYYFRVLADGSCPSDNSEFTTALPSIEVVSVDKTHITVEKNYDGETQLLLQEKNEKTIGSVANDIFFSKYFEASGFTKLVGLYNGTDHDIDISDLRIRGGKTSWSTLGEANYIELARVSKLVNDYGDGAGHIILPTGTEIILFSLGDSNEAQQGGDDCMGQYYSWNNLKNNVEPRWFRIGTMYAGVDEDGHNTLNFPGSTSLSLEREVGGSYQMIDLIGAGTMGAPTDAATGKLGPQDLGNGRHIISPNDKEGFYCLDGLSPESDEYPDGYTTYLSTNRCLLIRRNSVLDGLTAVASNTTTFATMCDEWLGIPVGNDGTTAERDCFSGQQFGYVGNYDYNAHYVQYITIDKPETDFVDNGDGTITITVNDLVPRACTPLRIQVVDNSGVDPVVVAKTDFKVPIIVDQNTTTDDIFTHLVKTLPTEDDPSTTYYTPEQSLEVCKECDVVVLSTGELTKATDGSTNDANQVRNLEVYAGGKVNIPAGTNYQVRSLIMRSKDDEVSSAALNGNLNIDGVVGRKVYHSKRIQASHYYWICLPYACNLNEVTWHDGTPATYGSEWHLEYYDGDQRAATQAGGCWKTYTGSAIAPGVGYIVKIEERPGHAYRELVFPMRELDEKTDRAVEVDDYGAGMDITPNHKGWNLVGNPFLNYYLKQNINASASMTLGKLQGVDVVTIEGNIKTTTHTYENDGASVPYVTVPIDHGQANYKQVAVLDYDLPPFISYFVQVGGTDPVADPLFVQFSAANLGTPTNILTPSFAPAYAAQDEEADPLQPLWATFHIATSTGQYTDEATIIASNAYEADVYQVGADLLKWMGSNYKNRPEPALYLKADGENLAFAAMPDAQATEWCKLGYFVPARDTYTISLRRDNRDYSRLDSALIYDTKTEVTTDLLNDDYTFSTTSMAASANRFLVRLVLRRQPASPEITTAMEQTASLVGVTLSTSARTITLSKLPEGARVWVYNMAGQLICSMEDTHYRSSCTVPAAGVYNIRIETSCGAETLRTIIK